MARPIEHEPVNAKTMLSSVKSPRLPFEWSLNPYRGCQHGCSFCYARAMHAYLGVAADDTFQRRIFLKANAPEALREQLRKMTKSKRGFFGRIAIGTATDPYQQVEAEAKLTRGCLEVLAEFGVPISITTRSPLVLRDIDILKQTNIASVNFSVNTVDLSIWRQFEPSTPSPIKRLEAVRALNDAGIPAGIFLAPVLPYLTDTDEELERTLSAASEHGARFVMPSHLRINGPEVKVWFFDTLRRHHPELVDRYAELYDGSPYLPQSYRNERDVAIRSLMRRYRLPAYAPDPPKATPAETALTDVAEKSGPVQLSFSF